MKSESKVFDSWALLAWLRGERCSPRVDAVLVQANDRKVRLFMSWINAGEIYYILARKNDPALAEEFLLRLPSLPIHLVLPAEADVLDAARLKAHHRLKYADAFAAALAMREKAALLTGDPELRELHPSPFIEWLG